MRKLTRTEVGRIAGSTTRTLYGEQGFYKYIGSLGGKATSSKHGHEFYFNIGEKGARKRWMHKR